MRNLERQVLLRVHDLIKGDIQAFTPSLLLRVLQRGQVVVDLRWGKTYHFYDISSLTKIVFASSLAMRLMQTHALMPNTHVTEILPWAQASSTRVSDLYAHTAGLAWWRPFFKRLAPQAVLPVTRSTLLAEQLDKLQVLLRQEKLYHDRKSVYSDLDVLFLNFLVTNLTERSLVELWTELQQDLGLSDTHFCLRNHPSFERNLYAPTEDCPWRNRVLQGEVHDENAWSLGGVSLHAGLFSTMNDLTNYLQILRLAHRGGRKTPFGAPEIVQMFTKRQVSRLRGDMGYLFWKPSRPVSTGGHYLSPHAFGHVGFTGTSLWFDPKVDVGVLILSHRVHPTRKNTRFQELRRSLHDVVFETLWPGGGVS